LDFQIIRRTPLILDTWGGLVQAGFPQQDLPPTAVPCDVA
jgi:hypothetical protein